MNSKNDSVNKNMLSFLYAPRFHTHTKLNIGYVEEIMGVLGAVSEVTKGYIDTLKYALTVEYYQFYLLAACVDSRGDIIKAVIKWKTRGSEVLELEDLVSLIKTEEVYCINTGDYSVESFLSLLNNVTQISLCSGELLTENRAVRVDNGSFLTVQGDIIETLFLAEVDNQMSGIYITEVGGF